MSEVRTRFAPSPTGFVHIGSFIPILYNYAFARKNKGKFILRFEDTDRKRYVEGAIEKAIETIHMYGIEYDEGPDIGGPYGPYIQSQKLDVYKKYAEYLVKDKKAYYCFCSEKRLKKLREAAISQKKQPMYDRHCLSLNESEVRKRIQRGDKYVIRLKVPKGKVIEYTDLIHGNVKISTDVIDDQVLLKSDGYPTYHLAVVVDDHEMKISHILRGAEWMSSTPKHIILYEAFGWEVPQIGHIPLLLDPEGGKLSKRKGSVAAHEFIEQGYLPEAVLNFLMLLGWSPKDDREFFTLREFVDRFSIEGINKSNPVFNRQKLLWYNKQYIMKLNTEQFLSRFINWMNKYCSTNIKEEYKELIYKISSNKNLFKKIIPLLRERVSLFRDVLSMARPFFLEKVTYNISDFDTVKSAKSTAECVKGLMLIKKEFEKSEWKNHADWERRIRGIADKIGWKHGDLFMLLRIAVLGSTISPPLDLSMNIIGYKNSLKRISECIDWLKMNK